jgi:ribosome-binding protein aMBF1 (putative translation factor)
LSGQTLGLDLSGRLVYLMRRRMSKHQPDMQRRIAANIRQAIEDSGLSAAELARRLGYNEKTLHRWQSGQALPEVDNLAQLAAELGVDQTWFYMPHSKQKAAA